MNLKNLKYYLMISLSLAILIGILYYLTQDNNKKDAYQPDTPINYNNEQLAPAPIRAPEELAKPIFFDGLAVDDEYQVFDLDETGAGISTLEVFYQDINGDGTMDKITRTRHETGNSHFWDEYEIKINKDGSLVDITPDDMRTIEGADCPRQKLQFWFEPRFQIIKISRPLGETTITPTHAKKTIYELKDDTLVPVRSERLGVVCDVTELFVE